MAVAAKTLLAPGAAAAGAVALALVPAAHMAAFYESLLYTILFWIALATSWNILSGYAHYLSFGHGAFYGAGVYAAATLTTRLDLPFLLSIPAAALVAALLALGIGSVVFRLDRLRGDLFALLTLAVAFVIGTIVLNTPLDGGQGVYLSAVPMPNIGLSPTATFYVFGLVLAAIAIGAAYWVAHSRLGMGLFAIHDDEDVAEAKGVPTFRYKMVAFAISSAIAGAVGAVNAMYVSYVTVGETFGITVPIYVVLMSVLGGMRHWLGPAVGAAAIAASLYAFTSGSQATVGRAIVAAALILVILVLPEGVVPTVLRRWRGWRLRTVAASPAADAPRGPPAAPALPPHPAAKPAAGALFSCADIHKSFGGIRALRGVSLDLREGEILGLVGPNGSGKTTFINVVTGQFRLDAGRLALAGRTISGFAAHRIAACGIARTYQIPRPFAHLTALENVVVAATFGAPARSPAEAREEARRWLAFTGLGRRADVLPAALNLHERKFLELARALAAEPRVLLLDEVLAGLTPGEVDGALGLIRRIRDRGTSIVFVEHNMRAVLALTDRLVVLNYGETIAAGDPAEVLRRPDVIAAYLGPGHGAGHG